jgi:hypothetical protein
VAYRHPRIIGVAFYLSFGVLCASDMRLRPTITHLQEKTK